LDIGLEGYTERREAWSMYV